MGGSCSKEHENILHSFRTDNALKRNERLCGNNDYCHVEIPTKDNKT